MYKYVPQDERKEIKNSASIFAKNIIKSQYNRYVNTNLIDDYQKLLDDGCFYLPQFICSKNDYNILTKLKEEISSEKPINWSKHLKYENPDFSPTFNQIVDKMAEYFGVVVLQTRLNYYRDGNDWKPFHHDAHAYGNKEENFTMGASFGDTRELVFKHVGSGSTFMFPQQNGDVFAFNKEVNQKFMHGVPKKPRTGERFSIIAWGKKCNNQQSTGLLTS
jgi:hypothetical protein